MVGAEVETLFLRSYDKESEQTDFELINLLLGEYNLTMCVVLRSYDLYYIAYLVRGYVARNNGGE